MLYNKNVILYIKGDFYMKNIVEEIMKGYRQKLKAIDKKYEVKEVKEPEKTSTIEIEQKIQSEKEFIEKLKFESEENNKGLIENAQERLKSAEKEREQIELENQNAEEKYQRALTKREERLTEVSKLKNSEVELASGRKVTMAEKDEIDKSSLKDETIKKLTKANKDITYELSNKNKELETKQKELSKQKEEKLKAKQEELKNKRNELFYFKYEYDEEHKVTNKAQHIRLSKDCKEIE